MNDGYFSLPFCCRCCGVPGLFKLYVYGIFLKMIKIEFYNYLNQWEKETAGLSSLTKMVNHPAYQEIIKMGWHAVPFILKEMKQEPNHLGYALHKITAENPINPKDAGNIEAMCNSWLEWAKNKNIKY